MPAVNPVNVPINTPSRLLVDYKNTENVFFIAYKVTKEQQTTFNKIYNDSVRVSFIKKLMKNATSL